MPAYLRPLMEALIYKSTGSWYTAKTTEVKTFDARMKGVFKIDDITSTNPIAVGDRVEVEIESETENTATITKIYERKNYIARSSPHHKMHHHIIASNLDQSLLFATLKEPKTSTGFIDRFLVSSEAYHVPAIIVFNKADLYRKKEMEKFKELEGVYNAVGYKVALLSMQNGEGMPALKNILKNNTTLLSGHSGVGKSTFINDIFPELGLRTQEVSGWSGKGLHTTTFAEMFDLPFSGKVIDTPGIREFGVISITKQELSHYFPEMRIRINNCRFNNCLHTDEPGCAVKQAVEEGNIAVGRYISYCKILESIDNKSY